MKKSAESKEKKFFCKEICSTILCEAVVLLLAVFIGTLLMFAAYHIPVNEELRAGAQEILDEQNTSADYPVIRSWAQFFTSFRPGVFDGGSATIIAWNSYKDPGEDILSAAMIPDYARYWHGYVVLWRPLLYFLPYKDLEILTSFIILFLALMIAVEVGRIKSCIHSVYFGLYFLLTMPMIVGMCLQYVPVALITYAGLLILLKCRERLSAKGMWFCVFFTVAGILTSFLDLLTYPLCTWGILTVWAILTDPVYRKPLEHIKRVIISGACWIFGYAGMWFGKAVVSSLILKADIISQAYNTFMFRTGTKDFLWQRINSLVVNWKHYSYSLYAFILLAAFLIWFIPAFFKGHRYSEKSAALVLVMASSPVWYLVCSNHTLVHHLFTYRIYGVMIMAGFGIMAESMPSVKGKTELSSAKSFVKRIAALLVCGVLALGMTMISYEETSVSNKTCPFPECREYTADRLYLDMDFVPAQNRITGICISVSSPGDAGEYVIRLADGGSVLYEEHFPAETYNSFAAQPVDWKVTKGKMYDLSIECVGTEMPVTYRLFDGDVTLNEIGPARANGTVTAGECLFEVTYWFRPYTKAGKLFYLMTWFSVFTLASCAFRKKR